MPEKISNPTQSIENNNALRQALVVIEHKIRNLEKRKTKLESYRAIQNSGKELSSDQKAAVAKYDEVAQSLEFARDLSKQMLQIANASEKEEKKRARREAILRAQAETTKIREVLTIQNILLAFSSETVRSDFVNGENGAVKLEEEEFSILEKFYSDIQVKRQECPNDQPFPELAQKAAEHLSLTIDGRPKQYGETTYENVKKIFQKIQDSGYLDRSGQEQSKCEDEEDIEEKPEELVVDNDKIDVELDIINATETQPNQKLETVQTSCSANSEESQQIAAPIPQIIPVSIDQQQTNMPKFTSEAPSAAAVPAPAFPPAPQNTPVAAVVTPAPIPAPLQQPQMALQHLQRQQATHQIPLPQPPQTVQTIPTAGSAAQIQGVAGPGHFPATTVRAVEQQYFKQHQYIQQMRPLAEVIGSGNFFFLQDSELDSPDMIGVPGPPHGFPTSQPAQIPQPQQQSAENQQVINISAASPTQAQNMSALNTVQPQTGGASSSAQQNSLQQQTQQSIVKQQANLIPTSTTNQSGTNTLVEPSTGTIPTQTFTNQSFPPIVQSSQVQKMFPQNAPNSVTHSPPGIHQQTSVVNINVSTSNEKTQPQPSAVSNANLHQQTQSNPTQTTQIPQVFTQGHTAMPSITPHQLMAHHQQQQTIAAQAQPTVAGTTSNMSIAEQQVAALASLQQQHNQHSQLQSTGTGNNNLSGLPTSFANAKFPANIVPTQTVQQQQTQIPPHHNLNNQVNNLNSIGNAGTNNLTQQSSQDKYDSTVRILENKVQKIDIKERGGSVQVTDIISTASVNDWESDAAKLQMQQQQQTNQIHKPPSHYSTAHNASHFHSAQHHNPGSNNINDRVGNSINESNQWSNDIHGGQNSSNTSGSGLSNKNNEWSSTFDTQESSNWGNNEGSGNYRGRQSFGSGRNDRSNGSGNGPGTGGLRNPTDRSENSRPGNAGGGYRGRPNYATSQNGNNGGPGSGSRNSNVFFRNNENYYQNGNTNSGGYNGGNKDNGNNRYGGGNGTPSNDGYRGRPTPGGNGGGPRAVGGGGPPPRPQRGSLGGGGMGPRGQPGGPRGSSGGYGSRPPRQQDVNVVN